MPCASHHQHVGAVAPPQRLADVDHAAQGPLVIRELRDTEPDRKIAGQPVSHPHGAEIAQMAWDRGRQNSNHAETLALRQRREDAAFRDSEHRSRALFPQRVEARIGETCDHEGTRVLLIFGCLCEQRQNGPIHVALCLYAGGTIGQSQANDLGPSTLRSGSTAASMPSVTAFEEFGLMT